MRNILLLSEKIRESFSRLLFFSFFFTFIISSFTIPDITHTQPTKMVGMIFEKQAQSFIISLFGTMGTLIGFCIYSLIFKPDKK